MNSFLLPPHCHLIMSLDRLIMGLFMGRLFVQRPMPAKDLHLCPMKLCLGVLLPLMILLSGFTLSPIIISLPLIIPLLPALSLLTL